MLEKSVGDLVNVLNQESKVYEDILTISRNKTKVITTNKISELENIIKVEQSLIFQVRKLEEERETLIQDIADELKIPADQLTVTELGKKAKGGSWGAALEKARDGIANTIKELDGVNDMNSKLIQSSLEYIDFTINLMTSSNSPGGNTYGVNGNIRGLQAGKARNLFDARY